MITCFCTEHRALRTSFLLVLLAGCGSGDERATERQGQRFALPGDGREFGAIHIPDGRPFPGSMGRDSDGDGYRWPSDCAPRDSEINPGAEEVCDGVDNDCNGLTDSEESSFIEGEGWLYPDADGDGFGAGSTEGYGCPEDGLVTNTDDCDDTDPSIGEETTWYYDRDGDGVGGTDFTWTDCEAPSSRYVESGDDCDDSDDTVYPGAEEVCDGVDTDCDGTLSAEEEDDADGDGSPDCEDCDDADPAVSPDAVELWDDADLDEDCDGLADGADDSTDCCMSLDTIAFTVEDGSASTTDVVTVLAVCGDDDPFTSGSSYGVCATYDYAYTSSSSTCLPAVSVNFPDATAYSYSSSTSLSATTTGVGSSYTGSADATIFIEISDLTPDPQDCLQVSGEISCTSSGDAWTEICVR